MANRKISELTIATSSLDTDGLVIQRGGTNFKIEAVNFTGGSDMDTGSFVESSSISGTTITFTKADGTTYTNEIVSASYAVSSSHEVTKEVSSSYADFAVSASYAESASLAQLALEAISASYAISASHAEVSDEAISSSYAITASHATSTAGTLSNGTSVDAFTFDGSTDVTVDISTYSASVSTDRTALSASLTTTDQTISSSVATLSGSASDARNLIAADLDTVSASFNERINSNDVDIAGLNAYSASLKTAIQLDGDSVTILGDMTVNGTQSIIHSTEVSIDDNILSLNGTGATNGGIQVNDPSGPQSGSLLWDGDNDRWIAGAEGSESPLLVADGMGILSSSAQIADEISGSITDTSASFSTSQTALSSSASDARNTLASDYIAADTALSASLTTTDQTISSSVATLSGSASDARNTLASDYIAADTTLSASLTTTDQTISSSVATLSGSASDARNQLASDYIAADTTLSASLTTTDQTISSSVANLSASVSTQFTNYSASDATYLQSNFVQSVNAIGPDASGNVAIAIASVSTGLSSSFPATPTDGDVYVISGETASDRTGSNGQSFIYSTDSTDWFKLSNLDEPANDARYVNTSGDTMTGNLFLNGDPTISSQAATKNYVDGNFVELTGDTMTGNLTIANATPLLVLNDTADVNGAAYIEFRGTGTATGRIGMKSSSDDDLTIESLRSNGDINLIPIGTGRVKVEGPSFESMRVVRTAGSGGCAITTENTSGDIVQFGIATTGNGFISTATNILQVANVGSTARVTNVTDPTSAQDAATKAYVDSRGTTGTNGQTIRFNGGVPTANSLIFNNGTDVGIGTTSPVAHLHVQDGASTTIRVGRGDLSPDRDFLEITSSGISGSFKNVNEHLAIQAVIDGGGATEASLMLEANNSIYLKGANIYAKNTKIEEVADPTAAQDAATKAYVDKRQSVMQFQKTNIQTTTGRATITFASAAIVSTGTSFGTMATTGIFTFNTAGTYRVDLVANTTGTHDDWGLVNNAGTRYLQYAGSGVNKYSVNGEFITVASGDNFRYTVGSGQTWNGNNSDVTTRIAFTRVD